MDRHAPEPTSPTAEFGKGFVIQPTTDHEYTAILIHPFRIDGKELVVDLVEELYASWPSDRTIPTDVLSGWRVVLPSSPKTWSDIFAKDVAAWFQVAIFGADPLTDTTAGQDREVGGIRAAVPYIDYLLDEEIAALGGAAERVFLGGSAKALAVGIWTLLSQQDPVRRLGAFVGVSSWLPFAENVQRVLGSPRAGATEAGTQNHGDVFVEDMMAPLLQLHAHGPMPNLATPIFLSHGTEDVHVDVELGRQVRDVLTRAGFQVRWREYIGPGGQGNWLKVPEEMEDIAHFTGWLGCRRAVS